MIHIPNKCDSCVHSQVCSKKDGFESAVSYYSNWQISASSKDIIVEVRCAYYGNVPTSFTTISGPVNVIREALDASNS